MSTHSITVGRRLREPGAALFWGCTRNSVSLFSEKPKRNKAFCSVYGNRNTRVVAGTALYRKTALFGAGEESFKGLVYRVEDFERVGAKEM